MVGLEATPGERRGASNADREGTALRGAEGDSARWSRQLQAWKIISGPPILVTLAAWRPLRLCLLPQGVSRTGF